MREATIGHVSGDGEIRTLIGLGINLDPKTGELQIDDKKLDAALKNNMADVQKMFVGEQAIAGRVQKSADDFVKKGGRIDKAQEGAEKIGKTLQDQYDTADQTHRRKNGSLPQAIRTAGRHDQPHARHQQLPDPATVHAGKYEQ